MIQRKEKKERKKKLKRELLSNEIVVTNNGQKGLKIR